jgi:hypothetical protein
MVLVVLGRGLRVLVVLGRSLMVLVVLGRGLIDYKYHQTPT